MSERQELDRILELQFIVAWAGEERAQPRRHPWWRTNWIDEYGGYDLLQRMAPRTAAWAQYELARKAARTVDGRELDKQARVESIRTIFHLGPELDRAIAEHLYEHKKSEANPVDVLPGLKFTIADWNPDAFARFAQDLAGPRNFVAEPFGKRLTGDAPSNPLEIVRTLVQGLLPPGDAYPRPYVELRGA